MTVELMGYPDTDREIGFNNEVWRMIRDLAEKLGWVPEGTSNEPHGPINDGYALNNFQYVSAHDAKNMAMALRNASVLIFGKDPVLWNNRTQRYVALCALQKRFKYEYKLVEASFKADWETCGKAERRARREFLWELVRLHNQEIQVFSEREITWYTVYKKVQSLIGFLDQGGYQIF